MGRSEWLMWVHNDFPLFSLHRIRYRNMKPYPLFSRFQLASTVTVNYCNLLNQYLPRKHRKQSRKKYLALFSLLCLHVGHKHEEIWRLCDDILSYNNLPPRFKAIYCAGTSTFFSCRIKMTLTFVMQPSIHSVMHILPFKSKAGCEQPADTCTLMRVMTVIANLPLSILLFSSFPRALHNQLSGEEWKHDLHFEVGLTLRWHLLQMVWNGWEE